MIILPHGAWALIPATLATMAWMTALSLDGCDFARLTGPAVTKLTHSHIYPFVEIGFRTYRVPNFYSNFQTWEIRFNDPRIPYGEIEYQHRSLEGIDSSIDSTSTDHVEDVTVIQNLDERDENVIINPTHGFFWKLGSMGHTLGILFGGSATLFLWVPCLCLSCSERIWRIGGLKLLLASFFHFLSFLWFFNSLCMERASKCNWHYGSYAIVITFLLYIAGFFCVFMIYPKPVIERLVQERIEKEFQRYERSRPDFVHDDSRRTHAYERSRPAFVHDDSRRTHATTESDSFNGSQTSELHSRPVTVHKAMPSRRNLF